MIGLHRLTVKLSHRLNFNVSSKRSIQSGLTIRDNKTVSFKLQKDGHDRSCASAIGFEWMVTCERSC